MDRRQYLSVSAVGITALIAGCSDTDDEPADDDQNEPEEEPQEPETEVETDENGDEEEEEEEEELEEVEEPEPQSFSGSGATVEQDISIEGGLTVVDASHDGGSNFQVSFVDDTEHDDNMVNVIGEYDGETADLLDSGSYSMDVEADGDWEIEVRQPRSATGDDLPQSLSGEGAEVHGPFDFAGSHIASGIHDGESNYQVQVYPAEGSFGESLFNEIGEYEGETTFSFSDIGWVVVQADGEWAVDLD